MKDPRPTDETFILYRSLPDDVLMTLLQVFQEDAQRAKLTPQARAFVEWRLAIINAEISRRSRYPVD